MKIRIETQRRYDAIIRQMAKEAGASVEDLAEAAVYNIIALYLKEMGVEMDQGEGVRVTLPERALDPVGEQHRDDVGPTPV